MDRPVKTDNPAGCDQACRVASDHAIFSGDNNNVRQLSDCAGVEGDYFLLPQCVTSPVPPVFSQPEDPIDVFWEQFGNALGIELALIDRATREACAVKVARLFICCLDGLQKSLKVRDEIRDQLHLDIPDIGNRHVSALQSATVDAVIDSLLDDGADSLVNENIVARAFRELQAHETAMLAGCRVMALAALEHFSPRQLGWQFEYDRGRPWLLTDGRQWRDYARHHHYLEKSGQWSERLLAHIFSPAYEQQFRLSVAFYQNLQE